MRRVSAVGDRPRPCDAAMEPPTFATQRLMSGTAGAAGTFLLRLRRCHGRKAAANAVHHVRRADAPRRGSARPVNCRTGIRAAYLGMLGLPGRRAAAHLLP